MIKEFIRSLEFYMFYIVATFIVGYHTFTMSGVKTLPMWFIYLVLGWCLFSVVYLTYTRMHR